MVGAWCWRVGCDVGGVPAGSADPGVVSLSRLFRVEAALAAAAASRLSWGRAQLCFCRQVAVPREAIPPPISSLLVSLPARFLAVAGRSRGSHPRRTRVLGTQVSAEAKRRAQDGGPVPARSSCALETAP